MGAKIKIEETKSIRFDEIKIGERDLGEILQKIYKDAHSVILNVSREKQSEKPNFTEVDLGAYAIMNLLEDIGIS